MDLACFGAGEKSRYVRRLILRHSNHRVLYYVEDQRFEKIGTKIDDMDVISVYKLKELYENGVLGGGNNNNSIS